MNSLQNFVNWKLTHADKVAEAEGYPLVMENCKANKKMKQLKVYGNSVQDGTPTPDEPIEVQSVGELVTDSVDINYGKYKIPIVQRGKNLLKPTRVSTKAFSIYDRNGVTSNGSYGTVIDTCDLTYNKVVVTQTPNPNYESQHFMNGDLFIKHEGLVVGKTYKISFDIEIINNPFNVSAIVLWPGGQYSNARHVSFAKSKQRVSQTFTEIVNTNGAWLPYMEIRCCGMSFIASNFMITEVDFDESFEPYVEPIATNVFLNETLGKRGNYADYIDFAFKEACHYNVEGTPYMYEDLDITLPKLTAKTTIIEVDTSFAPGNAYGKYIKK